MKVLTFPIYTGLALILILNHLLTTDALSAEREKEMALTGCLLSSSSAQKDYLVVPYPLVITGPQGASQEVSEAVVNKPRRKEPQESGKIELPSCDINNPLCGI